MPLVKPDTEVDEQIRQLAVANNRTWRQQAEYYLKVMAAKEYPELLAKLVAREQREIAEVA